MDNPPWIKSGTFDNFGPPSFCYYLFFWLNLAWLCKAALLCCEGLLRSIVNKTNSVLRHSKNLWRITVSFSAKISSFCSFYSQLLAALNLISLALIWFSERILREISRNSWDGKNWKSWCNLLRPKRTIIYSICHFLNKLINFKLI